VATPRALLAEDAAFGLASRNPTLSAHRVISPAQRVILLSVLSAAVLLALAAPDLAWRGLTYGAVAAFVAGTLFRTVLAAAGSAPAAEATDDDCTLPVYTVLVPLYREANVVPQLAAALRALDYPHALLDIKLIVEEDDRETVAAVGQEAQSGPFEVVRVPDIGPRTKPKACNYAMYFARGAFTVIFDAEDRPEPDQLRKAVAAFQRAPPNTVCLQARLAFYNADECWLSRLFALDYMLWFEVLLPGLDRLGVPIPLGGTSNHFRTEALRLLNGWDAFNVTEDADLGIRIAQHGMRVGMLDSTTFEEAPTLLGVWFRQRTRWLKGYMQTWLVHTRAPLGLARHAGWKGLLAFHVFVGGSVATALSNPVLWVVFTASLFHRQGGDALALSGLIGGNALTVMLAAIVPLKRGLRDALPFVLTVTIYWGLVSFAAWRGLGQLFTRPFHWEKTAHGLTRKRAC
jgi:cellulose synthase/poly-beta-1,6-N-acetylglucosamine synthase-like glycosyltransferase